MSINSKGFHTDDVVRRTGRDGKPIKKSGKFEGKSNKLGHGGRAAQLRARDVPEGVIGELARKAHAAPGEKNYHPSK